MSQVISHNNIKIKELLQVALGSNDLKRTPESVFDMVKRMPCTGAISFQKITELKSIEDKISQSVEAKEKLTKMLADLQLGIDTLVDERQQVVTDVLAEIQEPCDEERRRPSTQKQYEQPTYAHQKQAQSSNSLSSEDPTEFAQSKKMESPERIQAALQLNHTQSAPVPSSKQLSQENKDDYTPSTSDKENVAPVISVDPSNPAPYCRVNRSDMTQPCFMIAKMQEARIQRVLAPFIIPVENNKNLQKQMAHQPDLKEVSFESSMSETVIMTEMPTLDKEPESVFDQPTRIYESVQAEGNKTKLEYLLQLDDSDEEEQKTDQSSEIKSSDIISVN